MAVKYHKISSEPERVAVANRGLLNKTVIATSALVVAGVIASLSNTGPANSKPIPPQAANFSVQQQSGSIADLIENVKPAVVNISVTGRAAGQINYRSNQPGFPPRLTVRRFLPPSFWSRTWKRLSSARVQSGGFWIRHLTGRTGRNQ